MAEALASIGDTLHHNTQLCFDPAISKCGQVIRTCSCAQIEPFHEHTPIHTLPQIRVLPPDATNTQRVGIWRLETEHKRVLQGVILTPRAHIMAALAIRFAPTIDDTSHALVSAMKHTLAHSELYQFVRLIPRLSFDGLYKNSASKEKHILLRSHVSMSHSMITES